MKVRCPLCNAGEGICFDRRERAPILLNRTYASAGAARAAATGSLAFTGCDRCGFVWNSAFDETAIVYDCQYENDQAHSAVFRSHIDDMATRVVAMLPDSQPLNIVEVGAGQGVFLNVLAELVGDRLGIAVGFDPAWRGKPSTGQKRLQMFAGTFDARAAEQLRQAPNLVVSRHTIEHVARPLDFLGEIRDAFPATSRVRLAIETPCVEWIFDNWAVHDLFYEHCSLFTEQTLTLALNHAGFETASVAKVFGAQYLWLEATAVSQRAKLSWTNSNRLDFAEWSRRREVMLARWHAFLARACAFGPTYVWGAGAKGITFACMFDPTASLLSGLVDINPNKQGSFAAMTGCPIIAPGAVRAQATIIVMNPKYEAEVRALCDAQDLSARIAVFGERAPA